MKNLNSREICVKYLDSLETKQRINDTKNALLRYFVPSVGGPAVSAAKRRPMTPEEAKAGFEFLKQISLEELANAPDWALKTLEERDVTSSQKERVRGDLRNLVDWAIEKGYLPPPHNPIPQDICDRIQLGRFEGLNLNPATSFDIFQEYFQQLQDQEAKNDVKNGIIRYFVPATGGPLLFHKPALESEVTAAFQHLKSVPLEYLNEAPSIVTPALEALNLSQTQQTRIRSVLRDFIDWARNQSYLPDPNYIAPWGGEYTPIPLAISAFPEKSKSVLDIYNSYCKYLQNQGKQKEIAALRSIVLKYLVPACGGSTLKGKKASNTEINTGISYLEQTSIEQLYNAIELVKSQFEISGVESQKRYTPRSKLKAWIDWAKSEGYFSKIEARQQPQPVFNTFYKNGVRRKRKKPGKKLHENRCPVHALCAKKFSDDYINPNLKQQIEDYKAWRLSNDVRPGAIVTEEEQLLQILGWLHRYENVPLEQLSFECLITKSPLLFWAKNYSDYQKYFFAREQGIQTARKQADQDIERVRHYLDFTGTNPNSQKKRISLIIAVGKFLYRDLIGTDDFPTAKPIPIILRLLQVQDEIGKKAQRTPQSTSYHETSVSWSEAIEAMEKQRRRADQVILYTTTTYVRRGYREYQRPETALAHELQKFLSIAFCILVPSRSRTFYELRIGETFKEGILTETKFLSVEEVKNQCKEKDLKDNIKFYIHLNEEDYKSGKSIAPVLINNGGWWVELPNINFGDKCLYDYVRRWLAWGRYARSPIEHNYFFRHAFSPKPLKTGNWGSRIRNIFNTWTGVPVPPNSVRKMFASQFPDYRGSAALLLQHSESIHETNYDMRHSLLKMQPVINANQQFIADRLAEYSQDVINN